VLHRSRKTEIFGCFFFFFLPFLVSPTIIGLPHLIKSTRFEAIWSYSRRFIGRSRIGLCLWFSGVTMMAGGRRGGWLEEQNLCPIRTLFINSIHRFPRRIHDLLVLRTVVKPPWKKKKSFKTPWRLHNWVHKVLVGRLPRFRRYQIARPEIRSGPILQTLSELFQMPFSTVVVRLFPNRPYHISIVPLRPWTFVRAKYLKWDVETGFGVLSIINIRVSLMWNTFFTCQADH